MSISCCLGLAPILLVKSMKNGWFLILEIPVITEESFDIPSTSIPNNALPQALYVCAVVNGYHAKFCGVIQLSIIEDMPLPKALLRFMIYSPLP